MATYIHSKMTTNANKGHRIFGSNRSTKSSRNGGKGHVRFIDSLRTRYRAWGQQASCTLTFGDTEYDDQNDGTITLISTEGTSRTYVLKNDYSASSALEFNAGASASVAAANLKAAIESSGGHNGELTVVQASGKLTITQKTMGVDGNSTITATSDFDANCDVNVGSAFTGGSDDKINKNAERLFSPNLPFGASKGTTYTGSTIGRTNTSVGDKDLIRDSAA